MRIPTRMAIALLLVASLLPLTAMAAADYDNCTGFIDTVPASINTQGTWCLRKDISTGISSGNAINIKVNNVTIDCNGFKLGGLSAGVGTATDGIRSTNRVNTTVRNCNLRGFLHGVALEGSGSGGHLVEDNRVDGSTHIGLSVEGNGSVVRRNIVRDTGGSTVEPGFARGISTIYSMDVIDNIVSGVLPSVDGAGNGAAIGIYSSFNLNGSINGNLVRGLIPVGAEAAYGIYNVDSRRISLVGNQIVGDASAGSTGLRCHSSNGRAKDNIINGFVSAISGCGDDGNILAP